jgi:phage terminase large subunit
VTRPLSELVLDRVTEGLSGQRYVTDPVAFAREALGFEPWSKQVEIMRSVAEHSRTAVRAAHGLGKTATAAQVALWFLGTRPRSRVITTAPTFSQVEQLLWREMRAAVGRAHERGRGSQFPTPNRTSLEIAEDWFALGLSTNEPERFQGHHADHLLLIVDEASGVDDQIFAAAEGFLTAEGAKVLLIGNPTRIGGQFHRAFTKEKARWSRIHISAYDSPNVTGEEVPAHVARALVTPAWIEDAEEALGADSPTFKIRVKGEFHESSEDTLISHNRIVEAQARQLPDEPIPAVLAADIALSHDRTVIVRNAGGRVRVVRELPHQDLMQSTGDIKAILDADPYRAPLVLDRVGIGQGVSARLAEQGIDHLAFNGGESAYRPDLYVNRRAEVHYAMKDAFDRGLIDLDPNDHELEAQLSSLRWRHNSAGKLAIVGKDDMRKRGLPSPDRSDALSMTFALGDAWRPRRVLTPGEEARALAERVEAAWAYADSPEARMREAGGAPQLTDEQILNDPL